MEENLNQHMEQMFITGLSCSIEMMIAVSTLSPVPNVIEAPVTPYRIAIRAERLSCRMGVGVKLRCTNPIHNTTISEVKITPFIFHLFLFNNI